MAVIKPLFINQVEYSAGDERLGFAGLVAQSAPGVARTGVLGPAPAVSLSGSTVQVGPFSCAIGTAKGVYLTGLDSVTPASGSVAPADATNGRLDRIVLEVPADPVAPATAPSHLGRLRLVSGTAAAIPSLPALPENALHVGQVQVPKSGAGSPVVTVDCQFTAAAGAPVPVRSLAERDALDPNVVREALRLDEGSTDFSLNGVWQNQVQGLAGSAGWSVVGAVEKFRVGGSAVRHHLTLRLRRIGGTFSIGAGATALTGAVVPVGARPNEPIDVPVTYMSSAQTYGGSGVIRIEPSGVISAYPVAPTTSISLTQSGYFNISADWIV